MDMPKTAARAAQLVAASERATFDPFTEIDWEQPVGDEMFHLPPEFLPLYGTPQWEAMSDEERRHYSRHECAALCGAGIWFENLLIQAVMRHLASLPVTDPSHRYLLVEVADECRHSMMFGEFIRRAGTPGYRPAADDGLFSAGGGMLDEQANTPLGRFVTYTLILTIEELLDVVNRATMKDERVHPLSRQIAKIHVLEEARHVSFAKTYIAELWPTMSEDEQAMARMFTRVAVAAVSGLVVNPAVYETLGIDGGHAAATSSPQHKARIARDLGKLTRFLEEIGVITDGDRSDWQALGLVPA
jgi:hypothetical protein